MTQTMLKPQPNMSLFSNHTEYINLCLKLAEEKISGLDSISAVKAQESDINIYSNIDFLESPRNLCILEDSGLTAADRENAVNCVLDGKLFTEHAAAGEATRLGLGTKYLINIPLDLPLERISDLISEEKGMSFSPEDVVKKAGCRPDDLLPLSLGARHMLQFSYDIFNLAIRNKRNPDNVLSKQKMLIVLNEETAETILNEMRTSGFFGFNRENVFFIIQKSYHGINLEKGRLTYDKNSPKRLHNHGHIFIQQAMYNQIFILDKSGNKEFSSICDFGDVLQEMDDKMNFNIEDLKFLVGSIDYSSLALALKKGEEGYGMLMEIVSNDPENPQKGGMAAYDRKLKRNVMIEGFQLKGIKNSEIRYLNKNVNHYPNPYMAWSTLKEEGLNMPIAVKGDHIYFQPVQGDTNFLVKTEFFMRKELKPIRAWKSSANTPLTMKYMHRQDRQEGFKAYAEKFFDIE